MTRTSDVWARRSPRPGAQGEPASLESSGPAEEVETIPVENMAAIEDEVVWNGDKTSRAAVEE